MLNGKIIDSDDIMNSDQNEDKEILESIAYAEHKLGAKMSEPKKVRNAPW
jgi:hypothetical protein